MQAADLEPLDEYPGAAAPWRCRCGECGCSRLELFKDVKRRSGRGCSVCVAAASQEAQARRAAQKKEAMAAEAIAVMIAAGLEPLEPYPGRGTPWRCRCKRCDREVRPTYGTVKGGGGCLYCGREAATAKRRRIDADYAAGVMRTAGLEPLAAFPGDKSPWRCRCLARGHEVAPHFGTVQAAVKKKGAEAVGCRLCVAIERGARQKAGMAAKAEAVMREHGWTPLEPYPGALEPWPSLCGVCDQERRPTFAKVQERGQDRCATCSKEALSKQCLAEESGRAVDDLVRYGWEPLGDYPGVHEGWKALHLACGQIRYPRLAEVRAGAVCCSACNGSVRVSDEEAEEFMRSAHFKPLEPYPGSQVPWPCQCLRCGSTVKPRFTTVRKGGGCLACSKVVAAATRRANFSLQAEAEMRAVGLEPLEPCPGTLARWKNRHVACGRVVFPVHHLAKYGRGVCRQCSGSPLVEPHEAVARLTVLGLKPLGPYPGRLQAVWRMQCITCDTVVTKALQGAGGCRRCRPFGMNHALPALVYVLHHPRWCAVKVGITNMGTTRLADHRRDGWLVIRTQYFELGADAYDVEQAVLYRLRNEMGIAPFLDASHMRYGGATETADADLISPLKLWGLVCQARDEIDSEAAQGPLGVGE